MKKILIITMLFMVACVGSSYKGSNNDKQLVKDLVGTWEGSVYIDDEEIPTDYQFFECAEGTTGHFVEIAYRHEIDGDFDVRYFAYVSGEYTVKDGQLSLTYYPESVHAEAYDEEVLNDYSSALLDYFNDEGREILWEDISELSETILELLEETWAEICEERNNTNGDFSNLTIANGKMSFVAGERTLEFTRADQDWFTAFPYVE